VLQKINKNAQTSRPGSSGFDPELESRTIAFFSAGTDKVLVVMGLGPPAQYALLWYALLAFFELRFAQLYDEFYGKRL